MLAKTWYLGPLGDLRPLVSPDGGVSRPVERFGGVHQALSGARTMDITGHRASYELPLPWLSASDSRFVEALHYRTVRGPFWLLDPLARNRLSRPAAMLRPYSSDVTITSGGAGRSELYPVEAGVPITSLDWGTYSPGASVTLPAVPVLGDEILTASVWAYSNTSTQADLTLTLLGAGRAPQGAETSTATLGASWQRVSVTMTATTGTQTAELAISGDGGRLWLAAAQLENGDEPGEWEPGGAAPCVLIDQIERESPNYPHSDLTLTLLEV